MGTMTLSPFSLRRPLALAHVVVAIFAVGATTALAQGEIFVTGGDRVQVYVRTANGNAAPVRSIAGGATNFNGVSNATPDPVHNELAVANCNPGSVLIFPLTANGDVAPSRTISGAVTGLSCTGDVAVDTVNDEILVLDETHGTISAFARTASGNVAPLRVLQLTGTVSGAAQFALDTVNNELAVPSYLTNAVAIYARTASGAAAPLRLLTGAATGLNGPFGVAVDSVNNELIVGNGGGISISVYARTANGNTAPTRTIAGGSTGLISPAGVALDNANNELMVANNFLPAPGVLVYSRTANGDAAPARTITGAATGLSNPAGIAVTTGVPVMTGAVSRRVHGPAGTYDLPLSTVAPPAVNHNPTTEPRQGPAQSIVFTFDMPVNAAIVGISEGTATAGAPTFSGNSVIVPLTGVSNQQYVTVTLANVASPGGASGGTGEVRVGFLAGDVNQTRVVSLADLGLVNAQLAQPVTAANYLKDVNANGTLTVADKGIANANLTKALATP